MRRCVLLALLLGFSTASAGPELLGKKETAWLIQATSAQPVARRAAAFALGKLGLDAGPRVVPALTKMLADDDAAVRALAARGLGEIAQQLGKGAQADWPLCSLALTQALEDREARVRRASLVALGSYGETARSALEAIRKTLADPEAEVRQNAVWAIGAIGLADASIIPELCERLRDDDPLVRRDAVAALAELHRIESNREHMKDVGTALVRLLREEIDVEGKPRDAVVLNVTLEKWLDLRPAAPEHLGRSLAPLLRGEDETLARLSAFVLACSKTADAELALPVLRRALKLGDATTQEQAAASLGELGARAEPALLDLAAALRPDRAPRVRRNAAIALGQLGARARPALNHLIESIKTEPGTPETRNVRQYVVETVALIGYPDNAEALPVLADLIRTEKDSALRVRAVWSFLGCEVLDDKAIQTLTELLREPAATDPAGSRWEAARVLALALGNKAPVIVVEVLHEGLLAQGTLRFDGTGTRVRAGNEQGQGTTVAENRTDPDGRHLFALGLGLIGPRVREYPQWARLRMDLTEAARGNDRPRLKEAAAQALRAIGN